MQNYFKTIRTDYIAATAFALFIIGAIFPWRDGFGDGSFAHHRIVQLSFLLFLAIFLVSRVWRSTIASQNDNSFKLGALLFYAGGLLSGLMAASVLNAGLEYLHWILLGILFISCTGICSDTFIKPLTITFIVAHGLLIFLSILYLLFALVEGDPLQANVIYPATENIRFYNQIQVFVLPILLLLLKHPRVNLLAFIFFAANVLLLCIGGARGAALAVAFIIFLAAIALPSLRPHVMRALLASILAVIIYAILWWFGVDGLRDISRSGSSGRVDMWLEIIRNLEWHHLLWGVVGPANYVSFSQQFSFGHPHNSVLQWILEWGGISFVGAALIVSRILYKAVLYVKHVPDDIFALGLLMSWLAALAYSLVDGVIVMPIAQTLFIAFAGLLWGRVNAKPAANADSKTAPAGAWKALMVGWLILVITVPYVYFASQYYVQQSSTYSDIKGPRFWINGTPLLLPQ
jgi:hypothetical protein